MNHTSAMALAAATLLVALAACGDSSAEGGGGADDGKFHPPGNGSPVDEEPACTALHDALGNVALELGCVSTFRTCPSLVRSVAGGDCFQYDEGTIAGCVDYFAEAADCDDLAFRSDNCAFEVIADSAPGGCP